MEWTMPINDMLRQQISKLNYTLIPKGFSNDVRTVRTMQESLSKVINALGTESATSQGLNKVITSAEKLRNCPEHVLYLLKDPEAKGGAGEVVGLLKVGQKHLFLYDERDQVREVEPLCVLDFYVRTDRQRQGLGRILFDAMLQDTGATVTQLAIDGPSNKMERFLQRNYGVDRLVRQNNNFAVAPQFFNYGPAISTPGRTTPGSAPVLGRFAAPKPPSAIATVIHGGGGYHESKNGEEISRTATPIQFIGPEIESMKMSERPASSKKVAQYVTSDSAAGTRSPRRESQLTDRGYFDIKYYHNELWEKVASTAATPIPVPAPEPELELEPEVEPETMERPPERPSTLQVEVAEAVPSGPALNDRGPPGAGAGGRSPRRESQLTDRGYFDIKYYHNKLW